VLYTASTIRNSASCPVGCGHPCPGGRTRSRRAGRKGRRSSLGSSRSAALFVLFFSAGASLTHSLPWPFLPVPFLAPTASLPCRPWHGSASYFSLTVCRYILSRNALRDSAGGETFTCRLHPFAGGSSWQRPIVPPIAPACPQHRLGSAATGMCGRIARSFVAAASRPVAPLWWCAKQKPINGFDPAQLTAQLRCPPFATVT
jgi:hypothetical protein